MVGRGSQPMPPRHPSNAGSAATGGAGRAGQKDDLRAAQGRGDDGGGDRGDFGGYVGRGDYGGGGRGYQMHIDGSNFTPGRWGDDGYGAYGNETHRGSTSTGSGRGEGGGRGFVAPIGPYVEGASGPRQHYHPTMARGEEVESRLGVVTLAHRIRRLPWCK
ncbi:hypothetical protein ZWY2020_000523 [Hordeum vulgare]|nr:hypothetical protein ZWY2020_000523 [Hordeum vulgare]